MNYKNENAVRAGTWSSGPLQIGLECYPGGIRVTDFSIQKSSFKLTDKDKYLLFRISLKNTVTGEMTAIDPENGWLEAEIAGNNSGCSLTWSRHDNPELAGITVRMDLETVDNSFVWKQSVVNDSEVWSVWKVIYPQLDIAEPNPETRLFIPRGPGEVRRDSWREELEFDQTYPNGWYSMQFMALYSPVNEGNIGPGLYIGFHDPHGSARRLQIKSNPEEKRLAIEFETPAENMGQPGNDFYLNNEVLWKYFDGDWYDAAMIYRDWALENAAWIKELKGGIRKDTPQWLRDSLVWIRLRGGAEEVVPVIKKFAELIGLPVGFHWYNWHQIPYDNDYPHYFPAKAGFAEGIKELQAAGIKVMPYINGRLWDTRDRGVEDFAFSSDALPAVTKDEKGEPYIESYGSLESDGSKVKFSIMCPSTETWRKKLCGICHRLFDEYGVNGVYIDQVAAASPFMCFDETHSHQPGGGHWWNECYRELLEEIRKNKPADTIMTTECNADPFMPCFDGYLTWHWQYDGQVPAFSAIYGGKIQMFGRSFIGEAMRGAALRMKSGQQLVFGEQIGWVEAGGIIDEPESIEFLWRMGGLRKKYARYFDEGRMLRPPALPDDIPTVTADWKWEGVWPVTTSAIMSGAWQLLEERRLVLFFVNVSDEEISFRFESEYLSADADNTLQLSACTGQALEYDLETGERINS